MAPVLENRAKRLLLHHPVLKTGGAEMSALRMISALADRGWEITLVVTTGGGDLEAAVDPRVRLVRLRPRALGRRFVAARGLAARMAALPDLAGYGVMRIIGALRTLPFLLVRYDAAAALLMGMSSRFVRRIVRARTRAIWIRSDLARVGRSARVSAALAAAEPAIDHFVCVSRIARDSLVAALPQSAAKAHIVYNILASAEMRARAGAAPPPEAMASSDALRVLTVCRLSDDAKALFRMVSVARRLVERGLDFRWFIAGDGPDREGLAAAIAAAGLSGRMVLLGNLPNPFPAYAAADVVAMLSYYEGLSGAVNEARIMEKPVIATEVSGVDEQLTDGVNGLIVSQDEDAITAGMIRILGDDELRATLGAGGYPDALTDDDAKIDQIEELFLDARRPA